MCAFRFSQFVKKDQNNPHERPVTPASRPEEPAIAPLSEKPISIQPEEASRDVLADESLKSLRGLDNIIKELGLEAEDELVPESRFYSSCAQLFESLHALSSSAGCALRWADICEQVEGFDQAIEEEFGAFWIEALDAEFSAEESFEYRRNINVCIISLELARALKYSPEERLGIAAATLLYNVGGRDEPQNLSAEEVQSLLDRSMHILKKTGAPADLLRAVSEYKERTDGSGLPLHLKGTQISLKGQLVGLAVAFEHLFCQEQASFKAQGTAFQPVMKMLKVHRNHFNPQVLKSLLLTSGFYQVGAIVELNSGALARVITQNPGAPLRPLVEVVLDRAGNHPVHRQILDLRDNLTLSIVRTVAKGT